MSALLGLCISAVYILMDNGVILKTIYELVLVQYTRTTWSRMGHMKGHKKGRMKTNKKGLMNGPTKQH